MRELVADFENKGISIGTKCYEAYENDRNEPNIDVIKKLSEYYGLSMEDLCYADL